MSNILTIQRKLGDDLRGDLE